MEKRWNRGKGLQPFTYHFNDDYALETYTAQLDSVVGSYAFGKKSGAHLRQQLSVDFPSGSTSLPLAPLARRYNILAQEQINTAGQTHMSSCFRMFAKVVAADVAEKLHTLYHKMVSNGLMYSDETLVSSWIPSSDKTCDHNRASNSQALHFGRWQKYGNKPQITAETTCQNPLVSLLLEEFLTLISVHIAPRIAEIFKMYYPSEWKRQEMYVSSMVYSGLFSFFMFLVRDNESTRN